MKGLLFNIQKFSIHDGPGIRTVLSFKGCPLSCKWCSNPEGRLAKPCVMGEGSEKAPDSRLYSIEEAVAICLQDRPFYEESSGGVTISGGEVLLQGEFAAALLKALRKEGIHTAIETSGCAAADIFSEVSAQADLLLFDVKHYDDARHFEGTGVHNDLILANLKTAAARKKSILPRLAVIPGYNDSEEDAYGFASLLKSLALERVQLLLFHQAGERKYDTLNIPYAMRDVPQLHREDLEDFRRIISESGIDCFI
jgi:pyruvate formate lyase activating enzyme